jgi:uncharacterized protein (DUF2062 family)
MPKKFLRRVLPNQDSIRKFTVSRRFAGRLDIPELWQVQRDKIALGLAIGVFCGMIPGPLQMISAIALTLLWRVNLPMALIGTFLTNPLTIVPIYMLAYAIGQSILGSTDWRQLPALPTADWTAPAQAVQNWIGWVSDLGAPWLIGMVVLASALAALSYCLVQLIWRINQSLMMKRRQHQRQQRQQASEQHFRVKLSRHNSHH